MDVQFYPSFIRLRVRRCVMGKIVSGGLQLEDVFQRSGGREPAPGAEEICAILQGINRF